MYIYKYIMVNVISFRINWAITDRGGVVDLEYSRVLYVEIVHGIFRPSKDYFKKRSDQAKSSKKNYVGFPGVLVFGFRISKGCNTILRNLQRWNLLSFLSGNSEGKVTNLEIP